MDFSVFAIGFAALAAISWGLNSHLVKLGMVNANAYFALFSRSLVAFPILFILSYLISGTEPLNLYFSSQILPLVIASAFLIVLGDGLFMLALKHYPVKLIVPITSIYPLITTLILILGRVEIISSRIIIGTTIIVIGIFLVTKGGNSEKFTLRPIILGVTAATFWGSSIVIVRLILQNPKSEAIGLTGIRIMFMGIFSFLFLVSIPSFRSDISNTPPEDLKRTFKFLALSGIVGWVIGASAFFYAVQKIGAAIATPITSTNPIIASIIGVISKTETISILQFVGIIITVVGTVVIII